MGRFYAPKGRCSLMFTLSVVFRGGAAELLQHSYVVRLSDGSAYSAQYRYSFMPLKPQ